jgi:hypothetical protein
MTRCSVLLLFTLLGACRGSAPSPTTVANVGNAASPTASNGSADAVGPGASLPLVLIADMPLPGRSVRFDYQDLDVAKRHLIIAHMNDASVVVVNSSDGSIVKVRLPSNTVGRPAAFKSRNRSAARELL